MKDNLQADLEAIGLEVGASPDELERLSHDASLFELRPELAVYPRDAKDISLVVAFVAQHKAAHPDLSVTVRSGGTDMGGGAINDSIVLDMTRHLTHTGPIEGGSVTVQPGVFYRDFDLLTHEQGLMLPSYPASRELCTVGGMVANDAGGEKTLRYGKTHRYVRSLKIVLRDGQEHEIKSLTKPELDNLLKQGGLLAELHSQLWELVTENKDTIERARPNVTKNSTGYNLWDVWDGKVFDPTKIIVGSQGTLGVITEITFDLVPVRPLSGMVVAFLPSMKHLGEVINQALKLEPTSLESFDRHTLTFAFRFFLSFRKTLGWKRFILLGLSLMPVLGRIIAMLPNVPEIILMAEFEGETQEEVDGKLDLMQTALKPYRISVERAEDRRHEEKFWTMRRESFNLLRKNVKNKHTAPFIDDVIVAPEHLPEFLPKLTAILEKHKLLYTVAGHMGDGNFHIIPLMDLTDSEERAKIYPVLHEVSELILSLGGSLSGEHNDGLIRGPLLERMYGAEMLSLFKRVKTIFDPDNIFNPHKKTDATVEFSQAHMRSRF